MKDVKIGRKIRREWVHPAYTELKVRYAFTDPPTKGFLSTEEVDKKDEECQE